MSVNLGKPSITSSINLPIANSYNRAEIFTLLSSMPAFRAIGNGTTMRFLISEPGAMQKFILEIGTSIRVTATYRHHTEIKSMRIRTLLSALSVARMLEDHVQIRLSSAYMDIFELLLPEVINQANVYAKQPEEALESLAKSNFTLSQKLTEALNSLESVGKNYDALLSASKRMYSMLLSNTNKAGAKSDFLHESLDLSDIELRLLGVI